MRTTAVRLAAAATFTLLTLTGCAEDASQDALDQAQDEASAALEDTDLDTDLPDVDLPSLDLDEYSADFENRLQELTENADCEGLKAELEKAEGNDTELSNYLEEQIEQLDC